MGKLKIGYCYRLEYQYLIAKEPDKLQMPKNASRVCPALQDMVKNMFIIRSPYDIHLTYQKPNFVLDPAKSTLRDQSFIDFIQVTNPIDWTNKDTPLIQFHPQIIFVTDEKDLIAEYFPPWLEYRPDMPGIWTAAKINIWSWIRNTAIVFEWKDLTKPIIFKRGDPLMYVRFNTDKDVKLFYIDDPNKILDIRTRVMTHGDLKAHIKFFSREAMKIAGKFRPKKLL